MYFKRYFLSTCLKILTATTLQDYQSIVLGSAVSSENHKDCCCEKVTCSRFTWVSGAATSCIMLWKTSLRDTANLNGQNTSEGENGHSYHTCCRQEILNVSNTGALFYSCFILALIKEWHPFNFWTNLTIFFVWLVISLMLNISLYI